MSKSNWKIGDDNLNRANSLSPEKTQFIEPGLLERNSIAFLELQLHYTALLEQTIPLESMDQEHSDRASLSNQIVSTSPLQ